MQASQETPRGNFGRLGFVLAAAGSAIGLGNIWKFPYMTYANEGGSFVLVYIVSVLLIGFPIMMAEVTIGRRTAKSPVGAFRELAQKVKGTRFWPLIGWLSVGTGLLILSYYSVVAGWTIYYIGKCLSWSFGGFTGEHAAQLGTEFGAFLGDGGLQIAFHALFMIFTMGIVVGGVGRGIERGTKILMPALFVILLLLVVRSMFSSGFGDAMAFLFHVGPIGANQVLEALGLAFFSLSLGMGAMITYGSYVSKEHSIPRATAMVVGLDTLIAFMACIIMFTIIFDVPEAERAQTFSGSATILFTTLPHMLYELPGGALLSPLFYILVAFAALSSTISLLEVVVAHFVDTLGLARKRATLLVGLGIFLLGVPSALSLGSSELLSTMKPFGGLSEGFFGSMDYLASNWMLPVGGLCIAVFLGWFVPDTETLAEVEQGHGAVRFYRLWRFLLRFACPIAIAWILFEVIQGRSFS